MIQREVTVGRAPDSDILYDPGCVHVSNAHAVIYYNGSQLIFKDCSTNGTLINNVRIHHQAVVINNGDSILLAGKYPLTWDRIGVFFPMERQPTLVDYSLNTTSKTVINSNLQRQAAMYDPISRDEKKTSASDNNSLNIDVETARFNWGAFFLYPLWGFANGMWWAFLISWFLGWTIIPNILFGIMGSKWAWKNKQWRDINHFVTVQDSWKKWGIGLFLAGIFISVFAIIILMSVVSSF